MTRHTQRDPDPDTQMTPEDYEAIKPYAIMIEWDERDRIFLATVPDVRGCRTNGTTRAEAAANAEEALASMLATLADSAVPFPEPRFTALDDAIYAGVAEQSA
jgi:predicted RNase H-like HicB family nuclease